MLIQLTINWSRGDNYWLVNWLTIIWLWLLLWPRSIKEGLGSERRITPLLLNHPLPGVSNGWYLGLFGWDWGIYLSTNWTSSVGGTIKYGWVYEPGSTSSMITISWFVRLLIRDCCSQSWSLEGHDLWTMIGDGHDGSLFIFMIKLTTIIASASLT